jgi:hypothetical protein
MPTVKKNISLTKEATTRENLGEDIRTHITGRDMHKLDNVTRMELPNIVVMDFDMARFQADLRSNHQINGGLIVKVQNCGTRWSEAKVRTQLTIVNNTTTGAPNSVVFSCEGTCGHIALRASRDSKWSVMTTNREHMGRGTETMLPNNTEGSVSENDKVSHSSAIDRTHTRR